MAGSVLVTGAGSFIAGPLIRKLRHDGIAVTGIDVAPTDDTDILPADSTMPT